MLGGCEIAVLDWCSVVVLLAAWWRAVFDR